MWLDLLREAIAASSKDNVAKKIGVSRTQVSLIANGKYNADTRHFEKKFMAVYSRLHCPHLGEDITHETCRNNHNRAAPTSNPREMKHWRACQTCQHNETSNESRKGDKS